MYQNKLFFLKQEKRYRQTVKNVEKCYKIGSENVEKCYRGNLRMK